MTRRGGETRAQKLWGRTQRLIIFAVILLAVLAPLVGPQATAVHNAISLLVGQPVMSDAGNKFLQQVDRLQPDTTVLVVFDYDPTQAGEMDTMARAVFAHVLGREARILAVSLYPLGPATAQAMWEDFAKVTNDQGQSFEYGTHFLNLGYVPGQAVGAQLVSSLKFDQVVQTDFTGMALTGDTRPALLHKVNSIQDVSLIVDLAASSDNVRWWAEQLAIHPNVPPLVAGTSAAAAPLVRPYLSSKRVNQPDVPQLAGLIDGMPDALAYPQTQLQGQMGATLIVRTGMFEALSLASAALIILIVVGNIGQQVARLRRRR